MSWRNPLTLVLILLFLCPILYTSCARQVSGGEADVEAYEPPPPLVEETDEASQAAEAPIYDLEAEMPEQDDVEPEELEESIEPIPTDTVRIEEVVVPSKPEEVFGIGYRIQVFASSEPAAAERMKAKVVGETPLPVYIEYEGGFYKIRVGDFATREQAAAERAKISELYHDCWIVSTTIRK
jgi:cell division septation protein DedD